MNDDNNIINSVVRAIHILRLYDEENKYIGITDMSKRMDLPKSTIHRLVKTLESEGWLVKDLKTDKYKLGFDILSVASVIRGQYDFKDIAVKEMRNLSKEVNETVILSVYTKYSGICIEKIDPQNKIKLISEPGQVIPLHSGATGKILLAYAPEEDIKKVLSGELEKYTENTITDPNILLNEIKEIKINGYALSEGESDEGSLGIGVPILDKSGNLIYGLSIAGPLGRMEGKGIDILIEKTKNTADKISKKLNLLK